VDASTQALLDEAEAAGLVGDQHRSAMDRIAIATERMADAFERAFGRAGDAAEAAGKRIDGAFRPRTMRIDYETGDVPEPPGTRPADTAATGGVVRPWGIATSLRTVYAVTGAMIGDIFKPRGTDIIPAMLSVGEGVLNRRAVERIGGADAVHAINAGRVPVPAASVSMPNTTQVAGATVTYGDIHISVGSVDSPERVKEISRALRKVLRRGGEELEAWRRDVVPALVGVGAR
jgi:hypothetical protein